MPMLLDVSGFFLRREGLRGNYVCSAFPPLVSVEVGFFNAMSTRKTEKNREMEKLKNGNRKFKVNAKS